MKYKLLVPVLATFCVLSACAPGAGQPVPDTSIPGQPVTEPDKPPVPDPEAALLPFTDSELPWAGGDIGRGFKQYRHVMANGDTVDYLFKIPQAYDSADSRLWPLVLHLHAMGGGDQVEYLCGLFDMFWDINADLDGNDDAFILIPRYYSRENTADLLLSVLASFKADRDRLYLSGMSMGGSGSFNVAHELKAKHDLSFAAISRNSGNNLDSDIDYTGLAESVIWMHVGNEDGTRGVDGPVTRSDQSYDKLKEALASSGVVETRELHVSPAAAALLGAAGPHAFEGHSYDSFTVCLRDRTDWSNGDVLPLYAEVRTLWVGGALRVRQSVYYYNCGHDAFAMNVNGYLEWLFSQRSRP